MRLNELKLIRNDLNKKLNVLPSLISYYYRIRNNKVIKIKKDIDQESESTQTRKIQELASFFFVSEFKCIKKIIHMSTCIRCTQFAKMR